MKKILLLMLLMMPLVGWGQTIRYVDINNATPVSPYTNGWASAANTITAALTVASSGNIILITNGTYTSSGSRSFTNLTIRSVNGPEATIISAGNTFVMYSNSLISGIQFKNYTSQIAINSVGTNMVDTCYFLSNNVKSLITGGMVSNCFLAYNGIPTYTGGIITGPYRVYNCIFLKNYDSIPSATATYRITGVYGDSSTNSIIEKCVFICGWVQTGATATDAALCRVYNSISIGADRGNSAWTGMQFKRCIVQNVTSIGAWSISAGDDIKNFLSCYGYQIPTNNFIGNPTLIDSSYYNTFTWSRSNTGLNFWPIFTNSPSYISGGLLGGISGLRTMVKSPSINIGDNSVLLTNDFIGNNRFVGNVDLGAYEYFENPLSLPYNDPEFLYNALESKFPARANASVNSVRVRNVPTSPVGLRSGDVWKSGNELKVVE